MPGKTAFHLIDQQQSLILGRMRTILANMTRWEGFYETISLLQTVITMQQELRDETDKLIDRQLDDIFEETE